MNWIIKYRNTGEMHGHAVKHHICSRQTKYQYVEIFDTVNYGLTLSLDGIPQSSEIDEFIYHEVIVHPALCTHPQPVDVLIVGGGEGATLREVLKHSSVKRAVMVDLDSELVEICREYLGGWNRGAFDDPRSELLHVDGRTFLQNSPHKFDCIILDLSDPLEASPAHQLFTLEFYEIVKRALKKDGLVSLQAESGALIHNQAHCRIIHTLNRVFPTVQPYYTFIPLYATLYGFALCGGESLQFEHLTPNQIDLSLAARGVTDLRFFSGSVAQGLLAIPPYLKHDLENSKFQIITDSDPLVVSL